MFRKQQYDKGTQISEKEIEGISIERKVETMIANKEPIEAGAAEMIYMDKGSGVLNSTNIRTDKWDVALDAMTQIAEGRMKQRENKLKAIKGDKNSSDLNEQKEVSPKGGE